LRKSLEEAGADDAAYAKALTAVLKTLFCSGDKDSALVLRGILTQSIGIHYVPNLGAAHVSNRLATAGPRASELVDFIMSRDCPVSSSLTDADRIRLAQIKQEIEMMRRGRSE
jgi:hypothetical protein